jgi:hypothetical protein
MRKFSAKTPSGPTTYLKIKANFIKCFLIVQLEHNSFVVTMNNRVEYLMSSHHTLKDVPPVMKAV